MQVYNKKRPENQYDPKAGILFGIFSPGYLGFKAAFMPTYAAITGLEWAVKGVVGVGEGIATTLGGASLKSEQPTAQVAGTPMAREDISQGITALGSKSCASTFNNQASRNSLDRNASETLGCHTPSEKAQGRLSESYKR